MEIHNSAALTAVETVDLNSAIAFSSSASETNLPCYGFSLGKWNFLLQHGEFAELIRAINCTSVPNSPAHFLGLANLRGNVVPYYSFSRFFPDIHEAVKKNREYALLLGDSINGVLIEIDNKPIAINISTFTLADIHCVDMPSAIRAFVVDVYINEGNLFLMLSVTKLIDFLTSVNFPNYD